MAKGVLCSRLLSPELKENSERAFWERDLSAERVLKE